MAGNFGSLILGDLIKASVAAAGFIMVVAYSLYFELGVQL